MSRYRSYSTSSGCGIQAVLAVIVVVFIVVFAIGPVLTTSEYTELTVIEKSYAGGNTDAFVIWMQDESGNQYEFCNKDQWLRGKFNSSTVQGHIHEGKTYNIKTCGWRVPLFSMYENILEYNLVKDNN